eukprot:gene3138-3606_t
MGFGDGCIVEDSQPRSKRIRRTVERYGFETKNFISSSTTGCFVKSVNRSRNVSRELRTQTRNKRRTKSRNSTNSRRRTRASVVEQEEIIEEERTLQLTDLSEEVLLLILERVPAFGLINLSKTSSQFHRLCLMDTIWKQRCKIDFNMHARWPEFSFLYLYEMFYKADALRYDQNFFKPVSQLKTSVIVWYLMNPEPPCHVVSHLTASQVKSIWGITEEELEDMYFDDSEDRPDMFPLCHYEWTKLYTVFMKKHGGLLSMQNYVLKRCLRNRQALEEHYRLSLHTSRRQKWYQYLEDRDVGNREALKALTEHMPKVTYVYMLHKVKLDLPKLRPPKPRALSARQGQRDEELESYVWPKCSPENALSQAPAVGTPQTNSRPETLYEQGQFVCVRGNRNVLFVIASLQEDALVGGKRKMQRNLLKSFCHLKNGTLELEKGDLTLLLEQLQTTNELITVTEAADLSAEEANADSEQPRTRSSRGRKRGFEEDFYYYE